MTARRGLNRMDLAVTVIAGAALAATALHYGVPIWLLPLGAAPALLALLVWWLAGYRDSTYARTRRAVDAAAWEAVEQYAAGWAARRGGGR
jgi:hypothetical protein